MDYFDRERSLPRARNGNGSGGLTSKAKLSDGSQKPPRQPSVQQPSEGSKKSNKSIKEGGSD